jgi:hypothetical protein
MRADPVGQRLREAGLGIGVAGAGTGALGCQGAYYASMNSPAFADSVDFVCRHCEAQYVVRYTSLPIADSGSVYCDVCRRQMIQWNSSQEPSYKLVKRRDPK